MLLSGAAGWYGSVVRNRLGADFGGRFDVQDCRPDLLFKAGRRTAGVFDNHSDSADLFNHAGNPLGVYLSRRYVPDGRKKPGDSSGNVCVSPYLSRIALTRAREALKWFTEKYDPRSERDTSPKDPLVAPCS